MIHQESSILGSGIPNYLNLHLWLESWGPGGSIQLDLGIQLELRVALHHLFHLDEAPRANKNVKIPGRVVKISKQKYREVDIIYIHLYFGAMLGSLYWISLDYNWDIVSKM